MNLVELLQNQADKHPENTAYVFLADGETEQERLTFGELDRRARCVAAGLQRAGGRSERVLLLYPAGIDFIVAFMGCLYAGAVAVMSYPPRRNHHLDRLYKVAVDAQATLALTTAKRRETVGAWCMENAELAHLRFLATEDLLVTPAEHWQVPNINAETLAFIQYTSGSTGRPKGVMVGYDSLLHNLDDLDRGWEHQRDSVMVTWLPHYHDMGLIFGLLMPLYKGLPCYFMAPTAFLSKPVRWLQALSHYRGTHSAGPNFAYELCIARTTAEQRALLDLRSWRMALNAAEPVCADTMEQFASAFAVSGFRKQAFCPGYGLAEATLKVTALPCAEPYQALQVNPETLAQGQVQFVQPDIGNLNQRFKTLVGCGRSQVDTRIVIAEPTTGQVCKPGIVGEVWVGGRTLAQGYWQRPDSTRETFQAYTAEGAGPFLRTGDLGFVHAGELYITGRLKDLIIIRGVNYYPQDIEQTTVEAHVALRPGSSAAFTVDGDPGEQLVVVQEVRREALAKLDAYAVIADIRQRIAEQHEIEVHAVVLIKPATIPKTSSGKIQRSTCRQQFLDGKLQIVAQWRRDSAAPTASDGAAAAPATTRTITAQTIQDWLLKKVAQYLEIDFRSIDPREPFARYGLDSVTLVGLAGELEAWLQRRVEPTFAYNYPSIDALACHLGAISSRPARMDTSSAPAPAESTAIAVVGMACRFPQAPDLETFWRLLHNQGDGIREVPAARWDINAYYDPEPGAQGKMITRYGGFIEAVEQFDPYFFGISPREAESTDPQQRLILEVAWEALEHAGLAPARLGGSQTAVYVGISTADYARLQHRHGAGLDTYSGVGSALSAAASRLAYLLNLYGPSWAVDTACSSSLVAVHQACRSLTTNEAELAIVGGVNLILVPDYSVVFSQAGMLSPEGRCKTFDAGANGYVRGEGCGVVVLKRLRDAERDGDNVLAVIRGSAANQDGRSNGLTAPNGLAQEQVINTALRQAQIAPAEVAYLEAHGTGTALGDPIEVQAAAAALGVGRIATQPLLLGSVKAKIGHLEAAAGIAGLIKTALALHRGVIPPQVHFYTSNPHIPWDQLPVKVVTESTPWPEGRRIAGVSSFGFSGTNAHVMLEAYEREQPVVGGGVDGLRDSEVLPERSAHLLALSGKSEPALRDLAGRYVEWLAARADAEGMELGDMCFTAGTGRSHFEHRAGVVAKSCEQLTEALQKLATGEGAADVHLGQAKQRPRVALLFTGQGSQYAGMAKVLYESQPVFNKTLDRCVEIVKDHLDEPLLEVIFEGGGGLLDQTRWTQPALFAVEVALYETYRSLGIEADVVLGHSVGEYAAAYAAGILTLNDGLKLIAKRGELFGALPEGGSMAAIFADAALVQAVVDAVNAESASSVGLSIAAYNGAHVVVSGPAERVEQMVGRFEAEGVRCAPLATSHAFHSALLEPALAAFEPFAATIEHRPAERTLISNLTGAPLASSQVLDAAYWRRHAREPVQFARSVAALAEAGVEVLLELGPQPTLAAMALHCWAGEGPPAAIAALRRGVPADRSLIESTAQLYAAGCKIDFAALDLGHPRRKLSLPTYPFQRQRYWVEAPKQRVLPGEQVHPLLGIRQESASGEVTFTQTVGVGPQPWLADHRVFDTRVVPGAWYACSALAVGALPRRISEGQIHAPLRLADDQTERSVQVVLQPVDDAGAASAFALYSRGESEQTWTRHASGRITSMDETPAMPEALDEIRARLSEREVEVFYAQLAELGLDYGSSFAGLIQLFGGEGEALGVIETSAELDTRGMPLHPAVLDACWQTAAAALPRVGADPYLPVSWEALELSAEAPSHVQCYVQLRRLSGDLYEADAPVETITVDLWLLEASGAVFGQVRGLTCKRVTREAMLGDRETLEEWFYEVAWRERSLVDRLLSADFVAEPAAVAEAIRPAAETLQHEAGRDTARQRALSGLLARSSQGYVLQALRTLGWQPRADAPIEAEALREQLGVIETHRRLFGRLLALLGEAGVLQADENGWRVAAFDEAALDPETRMAELAEQYPEAAIERTLLGRCGAQLASVLSGRVDPLGLLFPEAGVSAEHLYRDAPAAMLFNQLVQRSVQQLIAPLPTERPLRVLEVGAGTGGMTGYVLPVLPAERTEYVYTDLSAGFFDAAEQRFGQDYPFITYRALNIERDPLAQGFAANGYDLILASNVVHATRDIEQTLAHCRRLLAPEGALVLLEGLKRQGWLDLTFGLLEGWWRFDDAVRSDYALMSVEQWRSVLAAQGFGELQAIQPEGVDDQAVLIARGPSTVEQTEAASGVWLVAADGGGVAEPLGGQLAARGQQVVLAEPGEALTQVDGHRWRLRVDQADDWQQLLDRVVDPSANSGLRGVVHLASLDAGDAGESSVETLHRDLAHAGASALALTQALLRRELPPAAGLWLVTQGAQSVDGEPCTKIAGSTLWGLGKSLALEHPELHCRCLDVDDPAGQLEAITGELLTQDREDHIALRGRQHHVARLVRSQMATSDPVSLHPNRTYLITGGLGGIGLAVAQWLADQGVRHIALNGRREPDVMAQKVITQLRDQGVDVHMVLADVTQAAQIERMLAELDAEMPPLTGVFHSVGVLRDGALLNQSWSRFEAVLGPKVLGGWHLHRRLAERDLDLFVLFASTVGVLGNRGQANHGAANAFLDQLARHRRALGLPAVSIDWGAWAGIGEAEEQRAHIQEQLAATGIRWIEPHQGIAALERILADERQQVAVAPVEWTRFVSRLSEPSPLVEELVRVDQARPTRASSQLVQRIRRAPAEQRRELLIAYLAEQLERILRLAEPPDPKVGFFDLGMDSLMAVELCNRLNAELKLDEPLSPPLVFDHPNVITMSDYLAKQISGRTSDVLEEVQRHRYQMNSSQTALTAYEIENIQSESELDVLLREELET